MHRRTIALILGSFLVIAIAGGAFILFSPIDTDTPHAADDETEPFTFDLEGEYTLTGTVVMNDSTSVRTELVGTEDGERYEYVNVDGTDGHVHEAYQASDDDTVHFRYTYFDTASGESELDRLNGSAGETVVDIERDDDEIRFHTIDDNHPSHHETILRTETILLDALQNPVGYETDESRDVYEPQPGWYELEAGNIRVSEASGAIEVDPDTNVIESADTTTRYAAVSDYREYLRDEYESQSIETTVEVEDDATVTRPKWVDESTEE